MIYLDNAATTWPKPESVLSAMADVVKNKGANPGRGGHKMALAAGRVIYEARETIAELFGINNPTQVVFTANATEGLNLGIKGFLKDGDHVITSSIEHNSVARPIQRMYDNGVEKTEIACDKEGFLKPKDVEEAIKENTRLIVLTHASNVTGTILPIKEIGAIARKRGVTFMIDAAQTAGFLNINVEEMNIDMLAFPGHKGLYGPQGTGGLYIREGIELVPLIEGGTGSNSEALYQPEFLPDRYESGTPNTVGVAGLQAGVSFLQKEGLAFVRERETYLLRKLIEGLRNIKNVIIYGSGDVSKQVPVVAFNFVGQDSSEVAYVLDHVFQICTRPGLHCAPSVHGNIGTLEQGAVRISLSVFNSEKEIDNTLEALNKIAKEI